MQQVIGLLCLGRVIPRPQPTQQAQAVVRVSHVAGLAQHHAPYRGPSRCLKRGLDVLLGAGVLTKPQLLDAQVLDGVDHPLEWLAASAVRSLHHVGRRHVDVCSLMVNVPAHRTGSGLAHLGVHVEAGQLNNLVVRVGILAADAHLDTIPKDGASGHQFVRKDASVFRVVGHLLSPIQMVVVVRLQGDP